MPYKVSHSVGAVYSVLFSRLDLLLWQGISSPFFSLDFPLR